MIAIVALILFAAGSAGGFALVRVVGGESVTPPRRHTPSSVQPATPIGELVDTPDDASTTAGEQGGTFTIPVPRGWIKFVEQRATGVLPNSTRVRYLSLDGTQQLTVERFPSFYPKFTISAYVNQLRAESPRYTEVIRAAAPAPPGRERAQELFYRTTEATGARGGNRDTFARLLPTGLDLWVIAVTVPIDQEDTGTKLFNKIAPGFKPTG
jgi:hypothetical protein